MAISILVAQQMQYRYIQPKTKDKVINGIELIPMISRNPLVKNLGGYFANMYDFYSNTHE